MDYIFITIAAAAAAVQLAMGRLYGKNTPQKILYIIFFPACTSVMIALLSLALTGFHPRFTAFGIAMAAVQSLSCGAYNMLGILASRKVGSGVFTMFVMLGGMLVPFLGGILFLGESPSPWCAAGASLIVFALVFSAVSVGNTTAGDKTPVDMACKDIMAGNAANRFADDRKERGFALFLCFVIFLLNGMGSMIMKIHQISPRAMGTFDYILAGNMVSSVVQFSLMGLIAFVLRSRRESLPRFDTGAASSAGGIAGGPMPASAGFVTVGDRAEEAAETLTGTVKEHRSIPMMMLACVLYTGFSTFGAVLKMRAAVTLPATALFPFDTGGTVIFGTLLAAVLFHERVTKYTLISLALMLTGTVLFLF